MAKHINNVDELQIALMPELKRMVIYLLIMELCEKIIDYGFKTRTD